MLWYLPVSMTMLLLAGMSPGNEVSIYDTGSSPPVDSEPEEMQGSPCKELNTESDDPLETSQPSRGTMAAVTQATLGVTKAMMQVAKAAVTKAAAYTPMMQGRGETSLEVNKDRDQEEMLDEERLLSMTDDTKCKAVEASGSVRRQGALVTDTASVHSNVTVEIPNFLNAQHSTLIKSYHVTPCTMFTLAYHRMLTDSMYNVHFGLPYLP